MCLTMPRIKAIHREAPGLKSVTRPLVRRYQNRSNGGTNIPAGRYHPVRPRPRGGYTASSFGTRRAAICSRLATSCRIDRAEGRGSPRSTRATSSVVTLAAAASS